MITKNIEDNNLNLIKFHDAGCFQGYASTFHVLDYAGDVILPCAFSWKTYKDTKLLWQHDYKAPIGIIDTIYEDASGLYVEGRIFLELTQGKEAYILIQNGVTNHLSIGYEVLDFYMEDGVRYITKINLWEVSVVTFPANKFAGITSIKDVDRLGDKLSQAIKILKNYDGG
jgi:HK97 family phage prohead protease